MENEQEKEGKKVRGRRKNKRASPPAPLRMERGVVCEVTPFGLLMIGDGPLNIWRTCRGMSVITPLSIRRGVGGEAAKVLALNRKHRALQLTLAVNSVISVACLQAFVSSKRSQKGFCSSVKICER